jgi:hypothetical protein
MPAQVTPLSPVAVAACRMAPMTPAAAQQFVAVTDDQVTPGLLGFAVVVLLGLATWFLMRSMNNQLKKVNFEETKPEAKPETRPEARPETEDDSDSG